MSRALFASCPLESLKMLKFACCDGRWDFNWRLVLMDGAGHPPPEMFSHPQMDNALFGHR